MAITVNPIRIYDLKRELRNVRRRSLRASRNCDYMELARLTTRAAAIRRELLEAEGAGFLVNI